MKINRLVIIISCVAITILIVTLVLIKLNARRNTEIDLSENALIYRSEENALNISFPISEESGKHYISYPRDWDMFLTETVTYGGRNPDSQLEYDSICLEETYSRFEFDYCHSRWSAILFFDVKDKIMVMKYPIDDKIMLSEAERQYFLQGFYPTSIFWEKIDELINFG